MFPTAQVSPKYPSSDHYVDEGDHPMDQDYLSESEILALLRDDSSSSPETSFSNALFLVAALSEEETVPTASRDEKAFVASETQTVEFEPAREIPNPEGTDDVSCTTPQSESEGSGGDKVAYDPDAWKYQIDLSHIRNSSLRRKIM